MYKNIKNLRFGELIAKNISSKIARDGSYLWECYCSCGASKMISSSNLSRGNVKSCGCLRRRRGNKNPTWNGYGEISANRFYNFKRSAETRGFTFNLEIEGLWELFLSQDKRCSLSGDKLVFIKNHADLASLDRINPKVGYEPTNVRWIRADLNFMKRNMTDEKFISLCRKVVK